MNNSVVPKSINFNELVKNSNTTLSLNIQDRLVERLNTHFTEDEQRWYVANLYVYMNYHPTNDYPINLEHVFRMIGFANKGNAMKTIKNNFTEGEDYKIVVFHSEKHKNEGCYNNQIIIFHTEKNKSKQETRGRKEETVMLNVDTFKNLCMLAKTERGKEIRKYYVKLENVYNEIVMEEIKESKKELEESKKELATLKKLKTKKWYNQEPGDTIYAIKIDNIIKIGKTRNIKARESYYTQNQTGDVFYIKKCHNCDLSEKVIHHMLDKHRLENNKEWFDISNELAIYMIDIVCDFLDNFINYSEKLPISNLKDYLHSCYKIIEEPSNKQESENPDDNTTFKEDVVIQQDILNKVVNITCNEDKMKRFIQEFCEISDDNSCLSYELFGAYRIWSKGLTNKDRSHFSKFIKKHYKSTRKYYKEYNESSLLTYIGIKPKNLNVIREDNHTLPKYEEFVLTECKYNYNYRMGYTDFVKEYKKWALKKYPDYTFSKQESFNMDSYLNRHFLKEKINMPGYRNVLGIWGLQLKSENAVRIGINPTHRKEIVKVDYETKKIIEEYKSLTIASNILKLERDNIRNCIRDKRIINDSFLLQYKKDVDLL
jgi:phage anti-repressor protein